MSYPNANKRSLLLTALLVLPALLPGCGGSPEEESVSDVGLGQRMDRIEELLERRESDALTDVHNQLQQMEEELRQLRGEVETQRHRVDELRQELEQVKPKSGAADAVETEPYQ